MLTRSRITGKERDSETGLDYFGARYYGSNMGRFMSPDPGPYLVADPQTWNRYTYTRNNPLKFIDPTGKYFVVAAGQQQAAQQYVSSLLRTSDGRAMVNRIAGDARPTFIGAGSLPRTDHGNGRISVTNGETTPIPGSPGKMSGTNVTIDPNNISFTAQKTGATDFYVGLKAFTHELNHVDDMNKAASFQGAAAAGAAGDAPSRTGAQDTAGGSAEQRAVNTLSGLGSEASAYTPNSQTDNEANAIIQSGAQQYQQQVQQQVEEAIRNAVRPQ